MGEVVVKTSVRVTVTSDGSEERREELVMEKVEELEVAAGTASRKNRIV